MTTNQLRELRKDNPIKFWGDIYSQVKEQLYSEVFPWIAGATPYAVEALKREFDPLCPLSQYVMPINTDNGVFSFKYSVHWFAHTYEQVLSPLPVIVAYYPMPRESWFTLLTLISDDRKLNMEIFPPHYFKQFAKRKTRKVEERIAGEDIKANLEMPEIAHWLKEWDWDSHAKHRIPAYGDDKTPKQFSPVIWNDLQCLDYFLVSDFLHFNKSVVSEHNPSALGKGTRVNINTDKDKVAKEWISVWQHGVSFCEELGKNIIMHKTFLSMPMLKNDQINALLPAIRDAWKGAFAVAPDQYMPLHLIDDNNLRDLLEYL